VRDDIELQERLVRNGNEFVEDFLRRERHELYARETLRACSACLQAAFSRDAAFGGSPLAPCTDVADA